MLVRLHRHGRRRLSGNLMSLGAIDFGLIVDGSVVMIENIVRHLGEWRRRTAAVTIGDQQMTTIARRRAKSLRPIVFAVAHHHHRLPADPRARGCRGEDVPADGADGGLRARRLAASRAHADAGARELRSAQRRERRGAVADASLAESGGIEPLLARTMRAADRRRVGVGRRRLRGRRRRVPFVGAEFIPRLDEGAIAIQAWRLPSVSLEESIKSTTLIEKVLKQFPRGRDRRVAHRPGRDRHRPDGRRDRATSTSS